MTSRSGGTGRVELFWLAIVLGWPHLAGAQESASPSSGDKPPPTAEILDEISIKAKKDTRVDTVEVREVRERSATDLGEALDAQGIAGNVRRGPIGTDVVLRWFQKDNLTLTIDGALVQGACPNRMDPPSFHVDYAEIDRVEVQKGPFDVTVPGGLGGTVRVNGRKPHPGLNLEANLSGSTNRHQEASLALGYGGRRGDVLGGYAFKNGMPYLTGDGVSLTDIYPVTSPNRYRDTSNSATAYRMHTAWAQAGRTLLDGRARLQLSYTFQNADPVLYPALLMDAVYDTTHRLNASFRLKRSGVVREVLVQAYVSLVDHLMNDAKRCSSAGTPGTCDGDLPRSYSMETDATSRVFGGRLETVLLEGDALRAGVDVYRRTWDATTTRLSRTTMQYMAQAFLPDVAILDAGAYLSYVRALSARLRLTIGGRLDVVHSRTQLANLDAAQASMVQKLYDNAWGPGQPTQTTDPLTSGNIQLDWTLADPVTLFLGVGHGERTPDPQERYSALSGSPATGTAPAKAARVGNPTIAPPRNSEVDIGLRLSSPRILAKAQVFGSYISDAIVLVGTTGADGIPQLTFDNVTATLAGGEGMVRLALPGDLYPGGTVTFTQGWNRTSGGPLQETPPLAGNVSLRWDIEWLFAEVEEQFAAAQKRVDPSVGELASTAWGITNLRAGGAHRGFKLMATAHNIFDQSYVPYLNYLRDPFSSGIRLPAPGWGIGLTIQYLAE
jgi:iron complex outermembrane recepter protein